MTCPRLMRPRWRELNQLTISVYGGNNSLWPQAMMEVGIDLSSQQPQKLTVELANQAKLLITMGCGEACPYVPGEFWSQNCHMFSHACHLQQYTYIFKRGQRERSVDALLLACSRFLWTGRIILTNVIHLTIAYPSSNAVHWWSTYP